jgi:hypothetical protein
MILTISTSIIDYEDEMINGGLSISIGLTIFETSFLAILWLHPSGVTRLECEPDFLKLFGVNNTLELPFYDVLLDDIYTCVPKDMDNRR